jgi:hypothetical protein
MSTGPSINIIVPATPQTTDPNLQGSTASQAPEKFTGQARSIDLDKLKSNLDQTLADVGNLLSDIRQKMVQGWQLEEVTVHLAISGEGSIGIVTASVEAGIDVTFTPAK